MLRLAAWLCLLLSVAGGAAAAHMFRYEMFTGAPNGGLGNFTYTVWDRWAHRVCIAKFDGPIACTKDEALAIVAPHKDAPTFDEFMRGASPNH